jgi:hypothetical protein
MGTTENSVAARATVWRKKPVSVRMIRWTGNNLEAVQAFTSHFRLPYAEELAEDPAMTAAVYDVLHRTWVHVYAGHWVVQGVQGENYPIDDDVLHATYDCLGFE